jgi:hypothetical protein
MVEIKPIPGFQVFDNPTIVVTWSPKYFPFWGSFAVLDVQAGKPIRIKGAGFAPRAQVDIKICEKNTLLGSATANICGAFELQANLPPLPLGVVSVKAYIGKTLHAVWPLDIVAEQPVPPTQ